MNTTRIFTCLGLSIALLFSTGCGERNPAERLAREWLAAKHDGRPAAAGELFESPDDQPPITAIRDWELLSAYQREGSSTASFRIHGSTLDGRPVILDYTFYEREGRLHLAIARQ